MCKYELYRTYVLHSLCGDLSAWQEKVTMRAFNWNIYVILMRHLTHLSLRDNFSHIHIYSRLDCRTRDVVVCHMWTRIDSRQAFLRLEMCLSYHWYFFIANWNYTHPTRCLSSRHRIRSLRSLLLNSLLNPLT